LKREGKGSSVEAKRKRAKEERRKSREKPDRRTNFSFLIAGGKEAGKEEGRKMERERCQPRRQKRHPFTFRSKGGEAWRHWRDIF